MASRRLLLLFCLALSLPSSLARAQGVVVETIPESNVLHKAGAQPGDVFHSWERISGPPERAEAMSGALVTAFDWEWMTFEQAMRGTVRLTGERQGRPLAWTVPIGLLIDAEVRPVLPPGILESYELGRDLLRQGRTAEAVACWRWLAETLRQAGDGSRAGWLDFRLARTLTALRDWDEAETSYTAALAEARDPRSRLTILQAMGDAYLDAGRATDSRECRLTELWIVSSTEGMGVQTAVTRLKLGWLELEESRLDAAEAFFERALSAEKALAPESGLLAETLKALGVVSVSRGDLEAAEHHVREALRMEQQMAPESLYVSTGQSDLGLILLVRGDLDAAEDLSRQAYERESRLRPGSKYVATMLENLAGIAQTRSDMAAAEDLYRQTLRLTERVYPGSMRHARTLEGMGRLAVTKGDLGTAEALYRKAEEILARVSPAGLEQAQILRDLGTVHAKRGQLERAEAYFRESLALSRRLAPESLQGAETLQLLASVLRQRGQAAEAARVLTEALDALEAQVGQLGGSLELKGAFRAQAGEIYRDAIRLNVETERSQEAFRLLERFRAQSFLALLANRDLTFSADIPAALDRERRRVIALYDRNELTLATAPDRNAIEALRSEQQRLRRRLEDVDAEIRQASPHLAAMVHPRSLTFEEVRAALDPGTVMLSYSVGAGQTQLFMVAPGRELKVVTIPVGQEALRREVEGLRQLIDQARSGSGLGAEGLAWASRRLYRLLIRPAEPWIAVGERIVIVPEGPLHRLPFAALLRERSSPAPEQYLVEWKPLHIVLSGTVYAEMKEQRRAAGNAADTADSLQWVAFGDPWFPPQLAQGRPLESAETRLRTFAARSGLRWERLPESRREVEEIARLFPTAARRLYLDREATEEQAKAPGRQARILHFATHGFVDDRSPFDSGLVLAIPEQLAEGQDNGLLQVWEIFERVRLDADLVVLSACETGLGEIRGGEGIIGLTRAFEYAGARSVLASLWQVDDKATADLMESFYRHLQAGKPKAEALRAAQLELLHGHGGRPARAGAAPYFWASMQLFGDWR